jgi:hypothetical protein
MKARYSGVFLLLLCCCAWSAGAWAQEFESVPDDVMQGDIAVPKPKINNLPFNIYGLSGLMVTTATRTVRPGSFEVGLGGSWMDSPAPAYYRREAMFLGAVGIPGGLEFGFRVPYVMSDLQITKRLNNLGVLERQYSRQAESSIGSVEGMFKWGFIQQKNFLPAFAMGIGAVAPGGSYDNNVSEVKYFGAKVLLSMGLELNDLAFTDYAFAILADGIFYFRDPGVDGRNYEEKSGLVHAGMIFPIHPRNFLELLLEYEGELMRGTTNEEDTNAALASLRFVTNHFNVTLGAKYMFIEDPDYDDTLSFLGTFSYTY